MIGRLSPYVLLGAAAAMAAGFGALEAAPDAGQNVVVVERPATATGAPPPGVAIAPMALGTGLVMGQAVDAGSKRPVSGALVTLSLPGASPIRAMADSDGRFVFHDLPRGRFSITASRPGYADGAYGRLRPGGPSLTLELEDGERVSTVTVALWKHASIGGFVLDELGEPLVGQTVRVIRRVTIGRRMRLMLGATDTTDDRGMYRIGGLEPGEYVVAVPVTPGTWPASLQATLMAGGEMPPAMLESLAGGGFSYSVAGGMPLAGGLLLQNADRAVVAGSSDDGGLLMYQTLFYPTATTASRAAVVTLGSGEERSGLDFQMRPVRTMRVSGMVTGPDGPAANLNLTLVPAEASGLISPIETSTAVSDGNGAFTFVGVPPGQYSLRVTRTPRFSVAPGEATTIVRASGGVETVAVTSFVAAGRGAAGSPQLPTDPLLWAELPVSVGDRHVEHLSVVLRPGSKVTGQIEFSGAAARPAPEQIQALGVSLERVDQAPAATGDRPLAAARGRVEPDGRFETMGVPAGRYVLRVAGAPTGWTLLGATHGGRDVSDMPFQIDAADIAGVVVTFTDRPTEVSGSVASASGGGDGTATVIAFPTDPDAWAGEGMSSRRLRNVRADSQGGFRLTGLPPGSYFLAAVPDELAGNWQDARFLEGLSRAAQRIQVAEGDRQSHSLKVIR